MSAECESNLFSQVVITDRIGKHKVLLLQICYKNYILKMKVKIKKPVIAPGEWGWEEGV